MLNAVQIHKIFLPLNPDFCGNSSNGDTASNNAIVKSLVKSLEKEKKDTQNKFAEMQ